MYQGRAFALLILLGLLGGCAHPLLPSDTLAPLMREEGVQQAWRVEQLYYYDSYDGRDHWQVSAFNSPHQSTAEICITNVTQFQVRRQRDRSLSQYDVHKGLAVMPGSCPLDPQQAQFRVALDGNLTEAELSDLIAMISSLIKTGSTGDAGISVHFYSEGAKKATHELVMSTLSTIYTFHHGDSVRDGDSVAFSFLVDEAHCRSLDFRFYFAQKKVTRVKIFFEEADYGATPPDLSP